MRQLLGLRLIIIFCGSLMLASCGAYKQNIMFTVPDGTKLSQQAATAEKNYVIAKNDKLTFEVYTNNGERIVDPDAKLQSEGATKEQSVETAEEYNVDINGMVKFPLVGELKVEGLTIRQAEEILEKEFTKFYKETFAVVHIKNRRVIVLGAPAGQVIPLANENMKLVEVLALAKGIDKTAKATNMRVLRGDQIFVVDFSTFDGYKQGNMLMESGDVVYIEPIRKPFIEALQEYSPAISVITTLTTLIVVFTQL